MSANYLGGIWRRGQLSAAEGSERHRPAHRGGAPPSPGTVDEDWGWIGEGSELFLRGAPACARVFTWDALALLVRGYARPSGSRSALDLERLAEELRCHYLEHGTLAVDDLEGSFTLALLDGQAGRVLLYRNLVGAGFTYYHAGPDGLLFGGNLAELVDAAGVTPRPNRDVLPAFFLYRCVPGRETLFADFQRLLPGEQVTWDERGLTRRQRHTFADLRAEQPAGDPAGHLEATLTAVLADCAALRPGAANLLSGGVDSSYLQAVWNRVAGGPALTPSYSVSVDHPHTWRDTDYAVTASQALGSRHTLTPADGPYAGYLIDALAATGEPINHVQSAYFGHLARALNADGVPAGLCGEGADSLFGLGLASDLQYAELARRWLPFQLLRRAVGVLGRALGRPGVPSTCRLADRFHDFTYLEHPVNRVAAFTDWEAAAACFGPAAVAGAAADRRGLLDLYAVGPGPMDRLHATGFLGEAMDSAGLWATLFNRAGVDLLCPFLDSRVLRLALNLDPSVRYPFLEPKGLLKRALARLAPAELATRPKLGFAQPIFEWLAPGGQLRPLLERVGGHDFLDHATRARLLARPTWFSYSLLCYDLWDKLFSERSLPRPAHPPAAHASLDPALLTR
jgi:asparagine synthase (glutamine-hydrolysing)